MASKKSKSAKSDYSYTIKVQLEKGLYRTIVVPGETTFETLAEFILSVYEFDCDHMYSFFMDNKAWSQDAEIGCRYSEECERTADEVTLDMERLSEKQKFLFLFDFGDDWRFSCTVMNIKERTADLPRLIKSVGKAPEQYPDYEDYEDYEDDEFEEDELQEMFENLLHEYPGLNTAMSVVNSQDEFNMFQHYEDELYEAAFEFKASKVWKKLYDTNFFAVALPNGELGYCTVMGNAKKLIGLSLYIGQNGWNSLQDLFFHSEVHQIMRTLISQDTIQCLLECKDDLLPEQANEVRTYAKSHGVSLRGANSFPSFIRYSPAKVPWAVTDEKEREYIRIALKAAVEVGKQLETKNRAEAGFSDAEDVMPLLVEENGGFRWETTPYPEVIYPAQFVPVTTLEFKKCRKKAEFECSLVYMNEPSLNPASGQPEFKTAIYIVRESDGMGCYPYETFDYRANAEEMLRCLTEAFEEIETFPIRIYVRDEATQGLLEDICKRCGVELKMVDKLKQIET